MRRPPPYIPLRLSFASGILAVDNSLAVAYEVVNTGSADMYFSVGAHPAFKIPLVPGTEYTDYCLQFNQAETAPRWPISPDGLIEQTLPAFITKHRSPQPYERPLSKRCAGVERHEFSYCNPRFRQNSPWLPVRLSRLSIPRHLGRQKRRFRMYRTLVRHCGQRCN